MRTDAARETSAYRKSMSTVSLIIPCYNEEEALIPFMKALDGVKTDCMASEMLELIFVDDGSKDGTLGILRRLAADNPSVKYLSLSRNFGKESAILAGLKAATGDYAAVMDADLQDPPRTVAGDAHGRARGRV